ncbi:MAG: glycosyltransferase family 4 protein [Deltaproteobacteria bacterium]|jgi:glycosyltransferase involved in cell wall biosynthesis|nr:glycosyltransferase family 4 protein [Deltaproteobacteria bacterium]
MKSHDKIIHTTCNTQWTDLEKRIFSESLWMEQNGHKIIIAAPKDTPLFSKAKQHGFKVYGIEFRRFSTIRDYNLLKNIFYNEKPDIVNTHGDKASGISLYAAKNEDVPLRILSKHTSTHVKNSWYNRIIYKKLCHYIFTTADCTTKHLQKKFKINHMRIFSMPNGITLPDSLLDRDEARKALAAEIELDPKTRFIGFAGEISKKKGVSTILRAFKNIKSKLSGYNVVIAGEGSKKYLNFLHNLAKDLQIENRVHFVRPEEKAWLYYRGFDCKILPSKDINGVPFEGIPQALLEAMYCSCPVIGSESGGIIDIIEHEKTGLLFKTQDPFDLAGKILQTLQDKTATKKRVEKAHELVIKKHSIDKMGRDIIRIYRLHQIKLSHQPF